MIEETQSIVHDLQRVTYGEVDGIKFRVEVVNLMTFGVYAKLTISNCKAVIEGESKLKTKSNIPDKYKLHVADINKKYGTYFLVESQLSKMEEIK